MLGDAAVVANNDDIDANSSSSSSSASTLATTVAATSSWGDDVAFKIVFSDGSQTLKLVSLMPRIVELARASPSRPIKVAAAELLHSLVLFVLGSNAQTSEPKPLGNFYAHVMPAMLRLAVDVDFVTRQLFEPLALQLVHYFARPVAGSGGREYAETAAIVQSLVDAVGDASDGALRDFAAQAIAEFLHWAIKQTNDATLKTDPVHVKSLLKRLYVMASHPAPTQRLGFALAVVKLHRVLREQPQLVDRFGQ